MKQSMSLWGLALSYLVGCGGKHAVGSASEGRSENRAGASGKEGGAGGSADSAPTTPLEPTLDPSNCSDTQPGDGEACSVELATCRSARGAQECMCVEWGAKDLRWYCDSTKVALNCPDEMPVPGSDCFGHFETMCSYPVGDRCGCDLASISWRCSSPRLPHFPVAPSSPDANTPIDRLDAEGRAQYCEWYSFLPWGSDSMQEQEVDAEGKAGGACAAGFQPACFGTVVMLSAKQCAQNLALSTCSAPLAQLTDCVTTMYSQCALSGYGQCACLPSPHGCARFFETPGCSGTLVISKGAYASQTADNSCKVQVE